MDKKVVLVGIHLKSQAESVKSYFESKNLEALYEPTLNGLLKQINRQEPYAVIMDLNLGNPNSIDIGPAETVYKKLGKKYKDAIFVGKSGNHMVVKKAKEQGIPAIKAAHLSKEIRKLA